MNSNAYSVCRVVLIYHRARMWEKASAGREIVVTQLRKSALCQQICSQSTKTSAARWWWTVEITIAIRNVGLVTAKHGGSMEIMSYSFPGCQHLPKKKKGWRETINWKCGAWINPLAFVHENLLFLTHLRTQKRSQCWRNFEGQLARLRHGHWGRWSGLWWRELLIRKELWRISFETTLT